MPNYSKDPKADSLIQLSEEVSRIAGTLAQLSTLPSAHDEKRFDRTNVPQVSAATVGVVIRARRLRSHYFSEELFADPAWDILLNLFHADLSQRRFSVSRCCAAAAVPATTALRWLKSMEKQGLIVRRNDPFDNRRIFVELAPETRLALQGYFSELENPAGI
jgi:DNA-binding MarR family transcriptional regulator